MAYMEFTMLSTELRRDPRWRRLKEHDKARLTFLSLFPTSLVDFTGYFHLPLEVFMYESMISEQDVLEAFATLQAVGLIEYDETTEFLRIVGWFSQRQTPCNAKYLKSVLKNYKLPHLPNDWMTARSLAELSIAALIRSRRFLADTDASRAHKGMYVGSMCKFIEDSILKMPDLPHALMAEFERADPEYRVFFDEVATMVPGLEKCRQLPSLRSEDLNGLPTVQGRLPDRPDTVSQPSRDSFETVS